MAPNADLRKLNAEAAVSVDGWTEVREERGDVRGKPRTGLRRPVIAYSTDLRRSLQLARRAVRSHGQKGKENGAYLNLNVTADYVAVEAFNPRSGLASQWFEATVSRTDEVPELLTRAALHLAKR